MNLIDPRTVILLAGIMSGLMSLVLFAMKRGYPASIKGLREWSIALLVVFIGGMLVSKRGSLPDILTVTLARFLMGMGLYIAYAGTQLFFGVVPRYRRWLMVIGGTMLIQAWFTYGQPSYHFRLVSANILSGLIFALHAHLVWRQGRLTFPKALTLAVLVSMSATQFMRLVTSFIWPVGSDILETAPHHVFYVTSFAFCILLFSIGMVLMATDRLRHELEHAATHDSLTNALTRREMNKACISELERSNRHHRSMSLLMMDLDHFKSINDTYGHQAGDQVLVNFVIQVNAVLRSADLLGRFGGEEFVALLPETSMEEATVVAERIRDTWAQGNPGSPHTVSIGVSTLRNQHDTVELLLGRADIAMYRAKTNGRNRVEMVLA